MPKTISCPNDLRPFGFNLLTGEACRVGARILTDVDEKARATIVDLLGLPYDAKLSENWNSGSIGSVMIPYHWFPMIYVWALLNDGARVVVTLRSGKAIGYYADDSPEKRQEMIGIYQETGELDRTYHVMGNLPGQGTRCEHMASGRIE